MEPRIQYAQTKDGVSIAFWTVGEGSPFVYMSAIPFSHIQLEWQEVERRRWYERLAEKRKLVRYDARGVGLSQRDVADLSLDSQMLDLEAVVGRLGLEQFILFAPYNAGPVGIAYAACHPERVSHLLLWCAYARGSDLSRSPQLRALRGLVGRDWETYTQTYAHIVAGWSAGEEARQYAAFLRESITQEAMQVFVAALRRFDVGNLLPQVRSPTLVLHRRQLHLVDVEIARGLTSSIADARLVLLEGTWEPWQEHDTQAVAAAIDEFLGEADEEAAEAEPAEAGAFRTVLFTDVEGSTALTQRLGDARAREVLREHERIVREALKSHAGSELKTMGDGFMASFASATRALESAIAMQRAFAQHNQSAEEPILVRVGLNAGEPIAEEAEAGREDLFGTAVIEAARIAAAAKGGEILVSDVVRQLAKGKDFLFADRGEVALRGFDEPVRLYEVRWREEG
jgi:class 3 adenylate cyclase